MTFLIMITQSPWGSTSPLAALRFANAVLERGHAVTAIYFRGDGVYNLDDSGVADGGTPSMRQRFTELADSRGVELLRCSSASSRRSSPIVEGDASSASMAGLARWWQLALDADRVVTF